MYSSLFCRLYNEFGWNEYPRVLAGQLLQWLNQRGATAGTALDLGCGTGVLCETLHENGIGAQDFDRMAERCAAMAGGKAGFFVKLDKDDCKAIYELAL